MPGVYTVEEAAAYLKVGTNTIYAMLRSGRLQGAKVGRAWRIPVEAVEEYLRGGQTGKRQERQGEADSESS